jgi:hypothetical protein
MTVCLKLNVSLLTIKHAYLTPSHADTNSKRTLSTVAYLEIWKGGAARIFGDLFFRTQTNLQNSRPKILTTFFLVTFHTSSKNPAKRHPPHHELELRGAAPDRLHHRPRQRGGGGRTTAPPPPKYATVCRMAFLLINSSIRLSTLRFCT